MCLLVLHLVALAGLCSAGDLSAAPSDPSPRLLSRDSRTAYAPDYSSSSSSLFFDPGYRYTVVDTPFYHHEDYAPAYKVPVAFPPPPVSSVADDVVNAPSYGGYIIPYDFSYPTLKKISYVVPESKTYPPDFSSKSISFDPIYSNRPTPETYLQVPKPYFENPLYGRPLKAQPPSPYYVTYRPTYKPENTPNSPAYVIRGKFDQTLQNNFESHNYAPSFDSYPVPPSYKPSEPNYPQNNFESHNYAPSFDSYPVPPSYKTPEPNYPQNNFESHNYAPSFDSYPVPPSYRPSEPNYQLRRIPSIVHSESPNIIRGEVKGETVSQSIFEDPRHPSVKSYSTVPNYENRRPSYKSIPAFIPSDSTNIIRGENPISVPRTTLYPDPPSVLSPTPTPGTFRSTDTVPDLTSFPVDSPTPVFTSTAAPEEYGEYTDKGSNLFNPSRTIPQVYPTDVVPEQVPSLPSVVYEAPGHNSPRRR